MPETCRRAAAAEHKDECAALEHNVRHHVECKQTFDGAAATAKVDRKNKTSAASARAMPKTIRRLQQQRATRGSEKSMRTIPSCTLISDTICMSTSASHVIASIHELDDITAMLAPSPPALLRQLDHPVLLCNRSLGPAEFFRVVNYAAAQHLADVPVALPDLTEVRPFFQTSGAKCFTAKCCLMLQAYSSNAAATVCFAPQSGWQGLPPTVPCEI